VNYHRSLVNFTGKQIVVAVAKATPLTMQTWLESRLPGVHVWQENSYLELGQCSNRTAQQHSTTSWRALLGWSVYSCSAIVSLRRSGVRSSSTPAVRITVSSAQALVSLIFWARDHTPLQRYRVSGISAPIPTVVSGFRCRPCQSHDWLIGSLVRLW
jgi:hypothetical protein